jgi:chromosome segregation ATPase
LQAEANQLALDALLVERDKAANHQRELDLIAEKRSMDREVEKRREARLSEVVQRLINQVERSEALVSQLATMDDAFKDTVERLNEKTKGNTDAIQDLEKAVYALLTRSIDEMQSARGTIKARLEKRDLLAALYDTLNKLQIQAARRGDDVPVHLQNAIEKKKQEIADLEGLA